MKNLTILLIFFFYTNMFAAIDAEYLATLTPTNSFAYQVDERKEYEILIPVDFGSSDLKTSPSIIESLDVIRISLYYSSYQLTKIFDQPELNTARFEALLNRYPTLKNKLISWKVKAQVAEDQKEARKLFHGFVIEYRPRISKRKRGEELSILEEFSKGIVLDSCVSDTQVIKKIKTKYLKTGYYKPNSKKKRAKGTLYKNASIFKRRPDVKRIKDTILKTEVVVKCMASGASVKRWLEIKGSLPIPSVSSWNSDKDVISKVLNKHDWKSMIISTDVTGSMSAYINELLAWHKLNFHKREIDKYYFFNDGDTKSHKQIGKTGGIYSIGGTKVKTVESTLKTAMYAGSGGDCPENDIEALIKAMKENPSTDGKYDFVLIADNYASMRDYSLIKKLDQPVHVIICGYSGFIHPEYLELARATKGTIHTINEDIYDLMLLSEGDKIEIGDQVFRIKDGKFKIVISTLS